MKTCLSIIIILLLTSCTKEEVKSKYLNSFSRNKYFDHEVLTGDSQNLYGIWKAYSVFGGWSGYSKPDFDYMEIKPYGIYGLIRNDTVFEYGKISLQTFDTKPYFSGYQVILETDYMKGQYSYLGGQQYFYLTRKDTLTIGWAMTDGITINFSRTK